MKIFENEYLESKRINTLPFRCHYIPFGLDDKPIYYHGALVKESSSKVISLNGIWNFKEYKRMQDFTSLDIPFEVDDKIDVPSCVQCRGHDQIQYLNSTYPFPFDPPYIRQDIPVFHYQKKINLRKKDNYYLVFEGVDNAFYLFINSKKVGYSLIAHSKSEFDITPYLIDGENKIDVVVLKWSASSYFECQDKFRFSGIFRDVYILNRNKKHITDYRFITRIEDKGYIDFINQSDVVIYLYFENKKCKVKPNKKITIEVDNPHLWSDTNPYLYEFKLVHDDEVIYEHIGIRTSRCENRLYLFNNKPLKFKGVNRHESNPYNGMSVTIEDTYQDLVLMKKLGINAIRTSHYPDIPEFYELCDHIGIYVYDEADVETHGAAIGEGVEATRTWQAYAEKEENSQAIFDREVSLFERDKNKTCVVIFSLGNEASFGKMFDAGLDYIVARSDRPVNYEGTWNTVNQMHYYDPRICFASRMYPPVEEIFERHQLDEKETRPFLIIEYSHAMGNSNGDIADYWKLFNSSSFYAGGFIWEWCDHAVMVDGKLHYGGDSNDLPNDGNFCVDGLVTPLREFKSNTLEVSAVYKGKLEPDAPIDKTNEFVKPVSNRKVKIVPGDNGDLIDVLVDGKKVFEDGIKLNFLRADIDNDMYERKRSYDRIQNAERIIEEKVIKANKAYYKGYLNNEHPLLSFEVNYEVDANGLNVSLSYKVLDNDLLVPRVGIRYKLVDKCDSFTFFGYGKDESYIDKHVHNEIGEFRVSPSENMGNNLKPQECGSHYYSSYLYVNDLMISADRPFSFSVLPYSQEILQNARHDYDLVDKGEAYICLDIAMAGVGTESCGSRLNKKYWIESSNSNTFKIYFK